MGQSMTVNLQRDRDVRSQAARPCPQQIATDIYRSQNFMQPQKSSHQKNKTEKIDPKDILALFLLSKLPGPLMMAVHDAESIRHLLRRG